MPQRPQLKDGVVQLALAQWFGEDWFASGDGFEAYSTLLARLSPWGRRGDGRLVLRNPLANALLTPSQPGLAALVVVLLGSTAFDGLSRTVFWQTGPGSANDTISGTVGLDGIDGAFEAMEAGQGARTIVVP